MGLSERKVKQRIGLDPRNLSWSDDKTRFSYKHMSSLGWQESKGLGSDQSGNPNHIAVVRKSDNGGIGMARALKEGDDLAAGAGQAGQGLADVLKRLAAGASASASPSGSPAPVVAETVAVEIEVPKKLRNKIASRQKHLHSKRLASSSPAALAEILGVPVSSLPASPSASPAPPSPAPQVESEAEATDGRTADETVTTSTLSVSDYFRQKMRERMAARQGASGSGSTTPVVAELPASSLENIEFTQPKVIGGTAWEGTKMAFQEEVVEFEPTLEIVDVAEASGVIDEKAAKKARKEAKRLAKLKSSGSGAEVEASPSTESQQVSDAVQVEEGDEKARKRAEKEEKRQRKEEKKARKASGSGGDEGEGKHVAEEKETKKKRKRDEEAVAVAADADAKQEGQAKKSKKDKKDKGKKTQPSA